ncbi:MAG: sensor histidine kinase [Ruminococcus sp.]
MTIYDFIINQLSIMTQMGAFLFLLRQIMKMKVPFFAAFGMEFAVQIFISCICYLLNFSPLVQFLMQITLAFAGIMLLFEGTVKRRLFAMVLQYGIAFIVSFISSELMQAVMHIKTTVFSVSEEFETVGPLLTSDILMIIIFAMCYFLLSRRHSSVESAALKPHMLFFIVTMSVHYGLLIAHYSKTSSINVSDLLMNYIFQSIIIISLYLQYFAVCRNTELLENNHLLSIQRFEQESEKRYYELARSQYEEISRIRHDMNNHLGAAAALINDNQQNAAQEIIEKLRTSLDGIKAVQYCNNPVINTILTTKANLNEYRDIDMQFMLKDCENIPCDNAELCSLISNLFDNAARAALESGTDAVLQIESGVVNEYFILKITNTAKENALFAGTLTPSSKKTKGHGYGMNIVRMIAGKYDGSFTIEQEGEFVTGTVMLRCR